MPATGFFLSLRARATACRRRTIGALRALLGLAVPKSSPPSTGRKADPKRPARLWLFGGAGALAVLVATGAVLYGFRGPIGVSLAVRYLEGRGVPAAIQIERLDFKGFVGSARLGPERDPDLTIERIEVEFEPIPIFKSGLTAPRLRSLRLVHPRLKARWDGKALNFGTLQPLVDEALKAPVGGAPAPRVRVEGGALRLATPYGALAAEGSADLDNGRLIKADARLSPTRLSFKDAAVTVQSAALSLSGGAQLSGRLTTRLSASGKPLELGPSRIELAFALPYGQAGFSRLDGPASADLAAELSQAGASAAKAGGVKLDAAFKGRLAGPVETLAAELSGQLAVQAASLEGPGFKRIDQPRAQASAARLLFNRTKTGGRLRIDRLETGAQAPALAAGGAALTAPRLDLVLLALDGVLDGKQWRLTSNLDGAATAGRLVQPTSVGAFALPALAVRGSGRMELASRQAAVVRLSGRADSGAGGFGDKDARALALSMASLGEEAKIAAALKTMRLSAPAWRLETAGGATQLRLDQPLRLGAATLNAAGSPLLSLGPRGGSGAGSLRIAGQGLPSLTVASPAFTLDQAGRVQAPLQIALGFSGPLLHAVTVGGAARLSGQPGALALAAPACLDLAAGSVGEETPPLASDAHARLCPGAGAPIVTLGQAGWRARVQIQDGRAKLPVSEAVASEARGLLTLAGRGAPETGRLTLQAIKVTDAAVKQRFYPIEAVGALDLRGAGWVGDVRVRDAAKHRDLAVVQLVQAMAAASGSAVIDATHLDFQPGVLQPDELSPVAGQIGEVKAETRFTGRIDWKDAVVTSSGRFDTEGAAFKSQFGQVTGAGAHIVFDSLIPLTAPAGQLFTADAVDWIAPLTAVEARFGLTATSTVIGGASAALAGGKALMGKMELPFDGGRIAGRAELQAIDLGALVAGSNLADSVAIDAKINGALPFSMGAAGFRIEDGFAVSTGPGRLSIRRTALTGPPQASGGPTPQFNVAQDFAYQALENLAFDSMEARIASRPEGRLGVIFRIKGRSDPPVDRAWKVNLLDLLRGKAFDKPIPLPKGTPIDLTLDTSLNFDELLKAYGELGISGSATVQPR